MADRAPQQPWDYLIEKGQKTTRESYEEYEQAIAEGDYEKAQDLYDKACRDAS